MEKQLSRVMKLNYGDIIEIKFGDKISKFEVLKIPTSQKITEEIIRII